MKEGDVYCTDCEKQVKISFCDHTNELDIRCECSDGRVRLSQRKFPLRWTTKDFMESVNNE